jgi:hypothetical protein
VQCKISPLPITDRLLLITLFATTASFANLSLIRGRYYDCVRMYAGHYQRV